MDKLQKFLRRNQVEAMTGLPRSSIYEEMYKGKFPRPIRISRRAVGWLESEVVQWQQDRISEGRTPRD